MAHKQTQLQNEATLELIPLSREKQLHRRVTSCLVFISFALEQNSRGKTKKQANSFDGMN